MKMNSFSHYAFGSVAEWMFIHGLGIDTEDAGYRNIVIKPAVSKEMGFMKGSYDCINGTIVSNWKLKRKKLTMTVSIPVNTKAKIYIPTSKSSSVKEGKKAISKNGDIKVLSTNANETVLEVGSGEYEFSAMFDN